MRMFYATVLTWYEHFYFKALTFARHLNWLTHLVFRIRDDVPQALMSLWERAITIVGDDFAAGRRAAWLQLSSNKILHLCHRNVVSQDPRLWISNRYGSLCRQSTPVSRKWRETWLGLRDPLVSSIENKRDRRAVRMFSNNALKSFMKKVSAMFRVKFSNCRESLM